MNEYYVLFSDEVYIDFANVYMLYHLLIQDLKQKWAKSIIFEFEIFKSLLLKINYYLAYHYSHLGTLH